MVSPFILRIAVSTAKRARVKQLRTARKAPRLDGLVAGRKGAHYGSIPEEVIGWRLKLRLRSKWGLLDIISLRAKELKLDVMEAYVATEGDIAELTFSFRDRHFSAASDARADVLKQEYLYLFSNDPTAQVQARRPPRAPEA